jgi:hypothetical protein
MLKATFAGLAVATTLAAAHGQATVRSYLQAHPSTAAAPLLILEPDRENRGAKPTSLDALGKKIAAVGAIKAIVAKTMIAIDASLSQPPNLYEGLPSDDKVIYLLRSLDENQWRRITGDGIGLDDLAGEQKLVFQSILPQPFAWSSYTVAPNGMYGKDGPKGTLSDDDRLRVRLKVERAIDMQVFLVNPAGAMSGFSTDRYHGKPGTLSYERDRAKDFVQTSAYGIQVRQEVENVPKPSQLDLNQAVFAKRIDVEKETTVGAMIRDINQATSSEIVPDFRVAERRVEFLGASARARDLLAALALSVEGTYRKVGPAYVLTSDLEGMGSRKLLLAYWQELVRREADRRVDEWRHQIGAKGRLASIKYDKTAPLTPSDALSATIDENDATSNRNPTPVNQLTPGLRAFLNSWDLEYRQQPVLKEKVGLSTELVYHFILPNGTPLRPEGNLGGLNSFIGKTNGPRKQPGPPVGPFPIPAAANPGFLVEVDDATSAQDAVRVISEFKGAKLWLITRQAEALAAAIKAGQVAGLDVGLAIRPWRWPASDNDRNIMGESGAAILEKINARLAGAKFDLNGRISQWMTPTDPAVPVAWGAYASLAATPGLKGVMLLETQPFGYEAKRERWQSSTGPLDWALLSQGFATAQRLDFLRGEGMDPIDMGDDGYYTTPDLRQTYFFDDGLRGMPTVFDGSDDTNDKTRTVGELWRKMLADANRKAMLSLIDAVKPSFIEPRLPNINSVAQLPGGVFAFDPANPLPSSEQRSMPANGPRSYGFITIWEDPASPSARTAGLILSNLADHPEFWARFMSLIDFTNIPRDRFRLTLDSWLKPSG